jgi:hypothetical protein
VVVEYGYVNYNATKMQSLKAFLSSEEEITKDPTVRQQIFFRLLETVNNIHDLGVPHLSINPESIWIENNKNVYLFPFKVNYEEETDSYALWYTAPEYLFNSPEYYFNYEWDVWSLGCIFYDLFSFRPPLFASRDPHSKLIKLFEVLGFPSLEHVPYINEDTHEYLYEHTFKKECSLENLPQIYRCVEHMQPSLATILLNMLHFNPNERPMVTPDLFEIAHKTQKSNNSSKNLLSHNTRALRSNFCPHKKSTWEDCSFITTNKNNQNPPEIIPFSNKSSPADSLKLSEVSDKDEEVTSEERGDKLWVEVVGIENLDLTGKWELAVGMEVFDGQEIREVGLRASYEEGSRDVVGSPKRVFIKDKEKFLEFYKKNLIKANVIFRRSERWKEISVPYHADLDVYTMANNDLKFQEGKYHLLDGKSIAGQIRFKFVLEREDQNEMEQSFLHPIVSDSETSNEASKELQSAIQRSISSRNEIDAILQKEVKNYDNPILKDFIEAKAKKLSYEPENGQKAKNRNDYEYKRRFMKMSVEGFRLKSHQPETSPSVEEDDDKENLSLRSVNIINTAPEENFPLQKPKESKMYIGGGKLQNDTDEEEEEFTNQKQYIRKELDKINKVLEDLNISLKTRSMNSAE